LRSNSIRGELYTVQNYNFACCFYGCETWPVTLREEQRLRVFENKVLRKMLVPKRAEVVRDWERVRNEEPNNLYCSSNIIRVIKSRIMRWAKHVARMGTGEGRMGVWWENLRERDHLEDLGGMGK
jgi:hypothetical protein